VLAKPSFTISHGGGQIIQKDSLEYRALRDWIGAGAPQGKAGGPRLERLQVYPQGQRLLVTPANCNNSSSLANTATDVKWI
jgi:hypothetical protein